MLFGRKFPLLRYFSVTSLFVIVSVAIVLSFVFRQVSIDKLIHYGEKNNLLLTQVLANTIWPRVDDILPLTQGLSREEFAVHPEFIGFDKLVRTSVANVSVLKIKIFNLEGDVVFSTEHSQIGDKKPTYDGVVAARGGDVFTKFEFRDSFNGINGPVGNRYVVSSYLPVRPGGVERPVGIFEVYFDVTDLYDDISETNRYLIGITTAILLLAYAALFGIVKRADSKLTLSEQENERHFQQISQQNQQLESLAKQLREARDEALDANRTKSAFVANMSHELRTPLNAIIGYSELLIESSHDGSEDLQKIRKSGLYLLSLINQVLDISKIEAGKSENRIEDFELVNVIKDIASDLEPMMTAKHLSLELDIQHQPIEMHSDPTKFRQIIYNLLSNAIKFTSEGGVTVTVTLRTYQNETWARIVVTDTGVGMSEDDAARLFNPFVRVGSKKEQGTGLGLAITKQLALHLGGSIDVESKLGRGTTFTVELPTYVPETKSATPPRRAVESGINVAPTSGETV